MADGRFSRNEALFGREGQEKIAATKVTIIGAGGLGSHIAQQLAYLGVLGSDRPAMHLGCGLLRVRPSQWVGNEAQPSLLLARDPKRQDGWRKHA